MSHPTLRGALTALVTPFTPDGSRVDFAAFERLVQRQIDAGITGLVPCGTTGETPTLTHDERLEIIRRTVKLAAGKLPVVAGTGSNDTARSVDSAQAAVEAGADVVMVVMPYYNRPSQAGLVAHVRAVASAVDRPIVLYNIPSRTGVKLDVDHTLELLDACSNVVGVKDATGGLAYAQELLARAGDRVTLLSGDDPLTLPMMSVGARGVISVTSNLYPARVVELTRAVEAGNWELARRRHLQLWPIHRVLFSEPNPQAVKAALAERGLCHDSVRLPMLAASEACRQRVREATSTFEAS